MDIGQSSQSSSQRTEFQTSPFRETQTRAVREYEETISQLKKENFDLKVRLYLCEEAHKETYHVREKYNDEKEDCVQVIVSLKLAAEDLKKELKEKEGSVQSVVEKYTAEIERYKRELQIKNDEQKEYIEILEQLPTAEDYNEIIRQHSEMVSDSENMKQLLAEKNEEIERLQKENVAFSKKVKQRDEAIKACALKYHKELDHIPKNLRPIIKSTIEAAVNMKEKDLLYHLESFKRTLIEIMGVPISPILHSTSVENSLEQDVTGSNQGQSLEVIEGDLDSTEMATNESIRDLTSAFSEHDLSTKLSDAYEIINSLKEELGKRNTQVSKDCQTNITWHSLQSSISEKNLQDFGTTNNISDLKEEILMLILAIEQKDKELYDINQKLMSQECFLSPEDRNFLAEREDLQHRLALSCSINNELLKHLQSLERFMENLLQNKRNISSSSLENTNESEDFIAQLSSCLNNSMKLSENLSNQLSICEKSGFFDLNDTTMHRSQSDISMRKSIYQSSQDESKISLISQEGRRNFYPPVKENQNVLESGLLNLSEICSSQKLQSFSGKKPTNDFTTNPDNVVVLKTSNNEDLILLLNDQGDPKDVLIRNNGLFSKNSDQHRRRCWDTPMNNDFWNSEKFDTMYKENVYNIDKSNVFKPNYMRYNTWVSSDSDTWSEPDRNVSMQRIGIDIQTSPISSRSPRKSRFKDRRAAEDSTKNESASSYAKMNSFAKRRRSSDTSKTSFSCKKCQKQSQQLDDTLREDNSNELQQLYDENANQQTEIENLTEMLKNKEKQIESLYEEKNSMVNEINDLKEALTDLQASNDRLISQRNESLSALEEKDSLNRELKDIIDTLEINVKDSDDVCEKLQAELNETKQRLALLDSKCAKYENREVRLSELEKKEKELIENIKAMNLQKDSLLDKLKEEEKRTELIKKENVEMTEKIQWLETNCECLESKIEKEKHRSSILEQKISLKEENIKALNEEIEGLKMLNDRIYEMENAAKKYRADNEMLVKLKNQQEQMEDSVRTLEKENHDLKEELNILQSEKSGNDEALKSAKFELSSLQKRLLSEKSREDYENMIDLKQKEICRLQEQIKAEEIIKSKSEEELFQKQKSLLEDIKKMKGKNLKLEEDIKTLLNNKECLEQSFEFAKEEISSLRDQLQSLNDKVLKLQSSADIYKADNEFLENQKSLLEQKNRELEDKISALPNESEKSQLKLRESPEKAHSPDSSTILSSDSVDSFKKDKEKYKKFIKSLQSKLEAADNRIDMLEKEKNNLRENLMSYVHNGKRTSPEKSEDDKLAELESKLETKQTFITELKSDLYKANDSLIDKQKENDKLKQELFKLKNLNEGNAKTSYHSKSYSDAFLQHTETTISDLKKFKKELINSLLSLQKQFYEAKNIPLDHFEKFTQHIENLRSLHTSPSMPKSESAPFSSSSTSEQSKIWDRSLKNVQIDMEVDIECLQNFKMFLKKVLSSTISQSNDSEIKMDMAVQTDTSKAVRGRDHSKLPSKNSSSSIEQLQMERVEPSHNRLAVTASAISLKLDWIENILKSAIEEFVQFSDMEPTTNETTKETTAKQVLLKIFDGLESLMKNTNDIFQMNSRLKSLEIFDLSHGNSKQYLSDHESLLSEETLGLSRSRSLSPVSFDGLSVPGLAYQKLSGQNLMRSYINQSEEVRRTSLGLTHKVISSSQDSVFQRSHYSSPDLGIESDPNHEHSAPEQVDKFHSTHINASKQELSISAMYRNLDKQRFSSIYDNSGSSFRLKDKSLPSTIISDTLHAIGVLEDYELLKKEITESIVGIKSILARTGDGMLHIANNTSPRKKLEQSTFKAIKDTCLNIDVCLQKAKKLVSNFWIATCPTEDEIRFLCQQIEELNFTLERTLEVKKKQEIDFQDALDQLKQAQAMKEEQEKEISKKLVKTKKLIRRAEKEVLKADSKRTPLSVQSPSKTSNSQS